MQVREKLLSVCGNVLFDEPMKKHTTFRIGGPADIFIEPESVEELKNVLIILKEENIKITVIGNGSNILVKDKGIRGAVIKLGEKMSNVEVFGTSIKAECGVKLSRLSNVAVKNSLTGLECVSGIPASLGGAVYMNAGAYGGEMSQVVREVECVTPDGEIKVFKFDELGFGYRKSVFCENGFIIVSCVLELEHGDIKEIEEKVKELTKRRVEKQPLNFASAGSTFKRPEGYFAGKLIEDCNLKGYSVGDAKVSEKHAGFVINTKDATAKDVLDLIEHIKNTVFLKFGVTLETEVKILGE